MRHAHDATHYTQNACNGRHLQIRYLSSVWTLPKGSDQGCSKTDSAFMLLLPEDDAGPIDAASGCHSGC